MSDSLLISVTNGVALIEFNRPAQLNCLDFEMIEGLEKAFQDIEENNGIHAVILTGRGPAFTAGLDLKAMSKGGDVAQKHNQGQQTGFIRAISDCSKPVIGAINGACVAGGLEIALCCDFLYASNKASFADTHAFVGVLPGWGLSQKFPRIVGIQRAKELSFTGKFFSAQQASDWGLVNEVFEPEDLVNACISAAKMMIEAEQSALRNIKSMIDSGWDMPLGKALQYESDISIPYSKTIDLSQMEQRLAMLRKRKK